MNRRLAAGGLLALVLAAGCGGPGRPTPTALPPGVARPEQPVPTFANPPRAFQATPPSPPPRVTDVPSGAVVAPVPRPTLQLPAEQNPTALGIARGPATLYAVPGGEPVTTVPAGTSLTVTGRSADGAWLAAYTADGTPGWVTAAQVTLFGAGDLLVVERAIGPGVLATMLAEAMTPVQLPEIAAGTPMARPALQRTGQVLPAEGVAVRRAPGDEAAVVAQVETGTVLQVLGRTADGQWLVVVPGRGLGWVPASALALDETVETLPVVQP